MHNYQNGDSNHYEKEAISYIKTALNYKYPEENISFEVAEIIKNHQPKAFFLENVKGLIGHYRGKTLETILNVLREDLDYFVPEPQIVNAIDFGLPQNRERIFIVGFRNDLQINDFQYPKPIKKSVAL